MTPIRPGDVVLRSAMLDGRLNFSLGCYGCREATDLGPDESVLDFPGTRLEPLLGALEQLAAKAIGRSRNKAVWRNLVADDQSPRTKENDR